MTTARVQRRLGQHAGMSHESVAQTSKRRFQFTFIDIVSAAFARCVQRQGRADFVVPASVLVSLDDDAFDLVGQPAGMVAREELFDQLTRAVCLSDDTVAVCRGRRAAACASVAPMSITARF